MVDGRAATGCRPLPLGDPANLALAQRRLPRSAANFSKANLGLLAALEELDLVALGSVDEGNDRSV